MSNENSPLQPTDSSLADKVATSWQGLSPDLRFWTKATIAGSLVATAGLSFGASLVPDEQGFTLARWSEQPPYTSTTYRANPPREVPGELIGTTKVGPALSLENLQPFARDFHELPLSEEHKTELADYLDKVLAEAGEEATHIELGVLGEASDEDHKTNPTDPNANIGAASQNNEILAQGRGKLVYFYMNGLVKERGLSQRVAVKLLGGKENVLSSAEKNSLDAIAVAHGLNLSQLTSDYNSGRANYLDEEQAATLYEFLVANRGADINSLITRVEQPKVGACDVVVQVVEVPPTAVAKRFPGHPAGSVDLVPFFVPLFLIPNAEKLIKKIKPVKAPTQPVMSGPPEPTEPEKTVNEDPEEEVTEKTVISAPVEKPSIPDAGPFQPSRLDEALLRLETWYHSSKEVETDVIINGTTTTRRLFRASPAERMVTASRRVGKVGKVVAPLVFLALPLIPSLETSPAQNPVPAAQPCVEQEVEQGHVNSVSITSALEIIFASLQNRPAQPLFGPVELPSFPLPLFSRDTTIRETHVAHDKITVRNGEEIGRQQVPAKTTVTVEKPVA